MTTNLTTNDISKAINTPAVKTLVNAYLLARAYAETMREKVNEIERQVLTEIPVYTTLIDRPGRPQREQERIMLGTHLYLCDDDELCAKVYAEFDRRERAAGLKPDDMETDYCPALVAEAQLNDIERELINVSGAPLGITHDAIMCSQYGLARRQQWIDLVVGAVVNMPDFVAPELQSVSR